MIIVRLMGGLGNQMFQYATARRLAHRHNSPLRLDISVFDNMAERDTPRQYSLENYKISGQVATPDQLVRMLPQDFDASFFYKVKRRLGLDSRLRPLGESDKGLNDIVLRARNNTYLVGWWQNEGYFADIRNILLSEFRPKKLSAEAAKIAQDIKAGPSVSIHIRRGDYLSNKFASQEHGIIPLSYYKSAFKYLEQKAGKLNYYIFSDDIDWCRRSLPVNDARFASAKDYEEIYLMSLCQHNVVANSSFSWWGAWLNDNPGKIVIAPKKWFKNRQTNSETQIVPDSWIRL